MAYPPIPVETFTIGRSFLKQTRLDRVPFRCSAGSFRLRRFWTNDGTGSPVSDTEYLETLAAAGLPAHVRPFVLQWVQGIAAGEWDDTPGDLERLIGRRPTSATEYLREVYVPAVR